MGHSTATTGGHHHAHHFTSDAHEFETAKQGMWLFLLQEVLFFSPLFVAYAIFRILYAQDFHHAHEELNWKLGALNTVVLITSSFTMARAVTAAQRGQNARVVKFLIPTILCAFGFMVVKYIEYSTKIHHGLLPAGLFHNAELLEKAPHAPVFFSLYFCMTGLHGIHVVGGIGALIWILLRAKKNEFTPSYFTPVEMVGLYWHFVDLVWIYLFPLLYLLG